MMVIKLELIRLSAVKGHSEDFGGIETIQHDITKNENLLKLYYLTYI